jgi:hypothetical protein
MTRKALRRGLIGLVLVLLVSGTVAVLNWECLRAGYAAHRLKTASSDEGRALWADSLASAGDEGERRLIELATAGEPCIRSAAAGALDRRLGALPENDDHAAVLAGRLIELFVQSDAARRESLVVLLPVVVSRCGVIHWPKCKEAAAAALRMPSSQARLIAIHVSLHPHAGLRSELIPLLSAAEPEVRRAAMFAIGPAADTESVVGDEELFRWLHDSDAAVRTICRDALVSRGRTDVEIGLGRRLVDPDARERLQLLLDLRHDDDLADPEPWLERLSRDAVPGVRAGAVRVAVELSVEKQQPPPSWVTRTVESDTELAVRRIARFYQAESKRRSKDENPNPKSFLE